MALRRRYSILSCIRNIRRLQYSDKHLYPILSGLLLDTKNCHKRQENVNLYNQHLREFHTSNINNDKETEPFVKIFNFKNPFTYFSLRMKLFLLRSYFDEDFNEDEFISGAKQAMSYVSTKISEGKISELDSVLTSQGIQSSRNMYSEYGRNPETIKVGIEDLLNISLVDVGFDYGEKGEKHANVLVMALCMYKEGASRKMGNIEVVSMPTKVLKYSFRRNYTPGVEENDWLVDNMEQSISDSF